MLSKLEPEDIRKHISKNQDFIFDKSRVLIGSKMHMELSKEKNGNDEGKIMGSKKK